MSLSTLYECHALSFVLILFHQVYTKQKFKHDNKLIASKYKDIQKSLILIFSSFSLCNVISWVAVGVSFPRDGKLPSLFCSWARSIWTTTVNTHTDLTGYHYDDVTWPSCSLNSQSFDCMFNNSCVPTSKKLQSPRYWPFVRGIHRWTVNSPHKGPLSRKKLPFEDIIMIWANVPWEGYTKHVLIIIINVPYSLFFRNHVEDTKLTNNKT